MLRYKTETGPGLVALYDIRPGNGAGQFLQPRSHTGPNCFESNSMCYNAVRPAFNVWHSRLSSKRRFTINLYIFSTRQRFDTTLPAAEPVRPSRSGDLALDGHVCN